jgi:hypothetical protein
VDAHPFGEETFFRNHSRVYNMKEFF